jgi:hypothetical protein
MGLDMNCSGPDGENGKLVFFKRLQLTIHDGKFFNLNLFYPSDIAAFGINMLHTMWSRRKILLRLSMEKYEIRLLYTVHFKLDIVLTSCAINCFCAALFSRRIVVVTQSFMRSCAYG